MQVIMTLRKTRASRKKNTRKKVTRLVFTVIIAYVICWLPYWLGQVALTVHNMNLFPLPVSHVGLFNYNIVASIFMYCNSAINPILYAFLSDNFRKSFFKACTWCAFMQSSRHGGHHGADGGGRNGGGAEAGGVGRRLRSRLMSGRKASKNFKMLQGTASTTSNWPRGLSVTTYAGSGVVAVAPGRQGSARNNDAILTAVPDDEEVRVFYKRLQQ
jgi:hypothetical protein